MCYYFKKERKKMILERELLLSLKKSLALLVSLLIYLATVMFSYNSEVTLSIHYSVLEEVKRNNNVIEQAKPIGRMFDV